MKNVCPGDSGGAALMLREDGNYELVGVNSWVFNWVSQTTFDCDADNAGAAAQRVDKSIDWLSNYMDIELEGDADVDSDTDSDTDSDSDTDTDPVDSGDTDVEVEDDPPKTPDCSCSGGPAGAGLIAALLGLVSLRRRASA